MRQNNAFRRKYNAAAAVDRKLRIAVVKANAATVAAASDNKAIAAGLPPDLTAAIATINQRLDDAAIP